MSSKTANNFIRGLHEYKRDICPGDVLSCSPSLDRFWRHKNPDRYSVAVIDNTGHKVFYKLQNNSSRPPTVPTINYFPFY